MSTSPTYSIIIPSYNYGHYLVECIGSLKAQTFSDWECWIIDDGSTDDTANIAAKLTQEDTRIKYHYQENAGLSAARNRGISLSNGRYIQFLDTDDLLEKDKLQYFAEIFEEQPAIDLLYAEGRLFIENDLSKLYLNYTDLEQEPWTLQISGKGEQIAAEFLKFNRFLVNMPIVKAEIAKKLLFDVQHSHSDDSKLVKEVFEKVSMRFIQGNDDWDFWMRIALDGATFYKAPFKENTYSLLRLHGGSMSTKQAAMLCSQLMMRIKWNKLMPAGPLKTKNQLMLQQNRLVYGIYLKQESQFKLGQRFIWSAMVAAKSLKYSLFALVSLFLSGHTSMKLLKKVTGQ